MQKRRAAIIGAGPSGLVASKVLTERGISTVCYEAGEGVGGQWVFDHSAGASACYRSVVANTHKGQIRFSDFGPDPELPDFLSNAQMAEYFESYARHFGLLEHIELSTRVRSVLPIRDGRWRLETSRGTGDDFDALVVATGRFGRPVWPDLPGELDGSVLHAKDYLDPDDPVSCRDRNVLIVGFGNTACDLAVELSAQGGARRVMLSIRTGRHVLPRRIRGRLSEVPHPADPMLPILRMIPPPLRNRFVRFVAPWTMRRMARGVPRAEGCGLPAPQEPPNPGNLVVNDDLLDRVRSGAIDVRPVVRALRGSQVEFADGRLASVDVLIAATGYDLALPFLPPELGGGAKELSLYRGILHPRHPNLYFVGLIMGLCSSWPLSEQQAMWIAAHLNGRVRLPPRHTIDRRSAPPAVLSRTTLNCQLAAAELRGDIERQARDHAPLDTPEERRR